MFFACHFQEEHSSLDNKNYVESIFILYRIKYQKIKIDLTSPLNNFDIRFLLCWEEALGDVSCNVFAKFIYMRYIPSVLILSTNFSLRMFLVCYFSY